MAANILELGSCKKNQEMSRMGPGSRFFASSDRPVRKPVWEEGRTALCGSLTGKENRGFEERWRGRDLPQPWLKTFSGKQELPEEPGDMMYTLAVYPEKSR